MCLLVYCEGLAVAVAIAEKLKIARLFNENAKTLKKFNKEERIKSDNIHLPHWTNIRSHVLPYSFLGLGYWGYWGYWVGLTST